MTSFVHVDQPTSHPGVQRAEILFGQIKAARAGASGSRPLIALLVVAVIAAVLVVGDKLVSTWDEGALLAAWAVLCGAVFAGIALFASSLRNVAAKAAGWRQQSEGKASVAAAAKVDALARKADRAAEARMPTLYEAMRRMNSSRYY
jgi:type VI protein secretion system component VasK